MCLLVAHRLQTSSVIVMQLRAVAQSEAELQVRGGGFMDNGGAEDKSSVSSLLSLPSHCAKNERVPPPLFTASRRAAAAGRRTRSERPTRPVQETELNNNNNKK